MKKYWITVPAVLVLGIVTWAIAQDTLPQGNQAQQNQNQGGQLTPTVVEQYSYAIGHDLGSNFRTNQTELNLQSLVAGLQDGLQGGERKIDEETSIQALQQLEQSMRAKAMQRQVTEGKKNKELGEQFLAQNRQRPEVQVTDTGLQYKVNEEGTGPSPGPNDTVRCNYRGMLIDGTVFDASEKHGGPAEFPVSGVIPGWTEALQKMKVGGKWRLFIPAHLAYADNPPGPPIEAGSVLIFDIELLDIVTQ